MNKKAKGTVVAMEEQWRRTTIGGVEQLKGAIATINDEQCFLVMLKLKDFQWSCNSRCDPKFNVIFHIEIIVLQFFYQRHL